MVFGIVMDFVYINIINKLQHEEDKQKWSCITGDYLCTDRRQHLSRWLFLQSTCKSSGTDRKQELLEQEKGYRVPQSVTEFLTDVLPGEVKT
jgi:hypothetical protein